MASETVGGICLSKQEIRDITERSMFNAQAKQLNRLGIDYRRRADGSIMILRATLEHIPSSRKPKARAQPNFEAIR